MRQIGANTGGIIPKKFNNADKADAGILADNFNHFNGYGYREGRKNIKKSNGTINESILTNRTSYKSNYKSDYNNDKSSGKKTSAATWIVIAVAVIIIIIAAYNLIIISKDYAEDANLYESLRSYTTAAGNSADGVLSTHNVIDFEGLKAVNPDIIAWIEIPGTDLSYPVVKTNDNQYYLTHGFDKEERKSGAIFTDASAGADFTDTNTILFGHNMKDGSMFAMLHNYEKQAYFDQHPSIEIYLPDGSTKEYRIFSAYTTSDDSDAYLAGLWDKKIFNDYVASAINNSIIESGVYPLYGDNLITLSTCVTGDSSSRFVVHAVQYL